MKVGGRMKAVFLENVTVKDEKHGFEMQIDKGEQLKATDRGNFYELRKKNGWGTLAPKSSEGEIYQII